MIKGAIPKPVELPIPKCCLIFLSNFTAFFELICEFLLIQPEYRGIVKRIQSLKNYPYSEVQDNVLDKKTIPIDMLRFKLSFFGANRYDPKSDRWLRVSFFSGAPYLSDLNNKNVDEWGFATMNSY